MKNKKKKHRTLASWLIVLRRKVPQNYFIIIMSVVLGFLAGLGAYLLKTAVFLIEDFLTADFSRQSDNLLYVIYPATGILLTRLFLRYLVRDETRHGIPRILYAISKLSGKMKYHKALTSLLGSSLTAGFGGSVGLEAPIISSGSSLGSYLSHLFRLDYKNTILLIGCGAAGAIASIFTTPVAAVIFSLEVLMLDLTLSSIIPLLLASATGAITTKILLAENMLVHFNVADDFAVADVPYYMVLGVFTGLVSLYFNKANAFVTDRLAGIGSNMLRFIIGGLALGLLVFLFPPIYGEGYDSIRAILTGQSANLLQNSLFYEAGDNKWVFMGFILALITLKVIATTLTIETGGIGGIFAPAAVTGGYTGFALARLYNDLELHHRLSENNFTLVGMSGVLGAVLHAPLTAIFLIAEMTHGYELIVPLMLSTTISFVTIKTFDPYSIFTKRLAEKGELLTHHKDQAVLSLLNLKDVVEKDIQTVSPDLTLGEFTKVISRSKRNLFVVTGPQNRFLGMIILDDVREDMFNRDLYGRSIKEYMFMPSSREIVQVSDSMESVLHKFSVTGNYNLVVLKGDTYIGVVSRANIFKAYRKTLIDVSHE
ncbi:MAG: chloride channel protein [Bacteroidales bacterium]